MVHTLDGSEGQKVSYMALDALLRLANTDKNQLQASNL